ncbi:MAG TPA: hypothetical protein VGU74_05810 [Gemmatimonadales bacterium]|nr:hypothetical protein [Gemmatimonadales bacterium]
MSRPGAMRQVRTMASHESGRIVTLPMRQGPAPTFTLPKASITITVLRGKR